MSFGRLRFVYFVAETIGKSPRIDRAASASRSAGAEAPRDRRHAPDHGLETVHDRLAHVRPDMRANAALGSLLDWAFGLALMLLFQEPNLSIVAPDIFRHSAHRADTVFPRLAVAHVFGSFR
jgi:hypothetical protein